MTGQHSSGETDQEKRDHQRTDEQHDSTRRGEHRYPDSDQRPADRKARQDRDDLKERLRRRSSEP